MLCMYVCVKGQISRAKQNKTKQNHSYTGKMKSAALKIKC